MQAGARPLGRGAARAGRHPPPNPTLNQLRRGSHAELACRGACARRAGLNTRVPCVSLCRGLWGVCRVSEGFRSPVGHSKSRECGPQARLTARPAACAVSRPAISRCRSIGAPAVPALRASRSHKRPPRLAAPPRLGSAVHPHHEVRGGGLTPAAVLQRRAGKQGVSRQRANSGACTAPGCRRRCGAWACGAGLARLGASACAQAWQRRWQSRAPQRGLAATQRESGRRGGPAPAPPAAHRRRSACLPLSCPGPQPACERRSPAQSLPLLVSRRRWTWPPSCRTPSTPPSC